MLIDDDRLIFHTIDDHHWDFGVDNTGNIMSEMNINHYIERFQPMGISLVSPIIPLNDCVIQLQIVFRELNSFFCSIVDYC